MCTARNGRLSFPHCDKVPPNHRPMGDRPSPRAGDADHSDHVVKGRLPAGARLGLQTEFKAGELRPPTECIKGHSWVF